MNQDLIQITRSNENFAGVVMAAFMVGGISCSSWGAKRWHRVQQRRDDEIADLQLRKLQAEVDKLEAEAVELKPSSDDNTG